MKVKAVLRGHSAAVRAIAFSPDETTVATGSDDKEVKLWDTASGKLRSRLQHEASVTSLSFSKDGAVLATGGQDLRLWDAQGTRCEATVSLTAWVMALAFQPTDKTLVVCLGNGTVRRWSMLRKRFYRSITLREEDPYARLYPLLTVALSSDCRTIATGRSYIGWEKEA